MLAVGRLVPVALVSQSDQLVRNKQQARNVSVLVAQTHPSNEGRMHIAHFLVLASILTALLSCTAGSSSPTATPAPAPNALIVRTPSATSLPIAPSTQPTPTAEFGDIPERVETTPFPTIPLPIQRAPNFALGFGYGSCRITRRLDTFTQTLTQFSLDGTPMTITLTLQPNELDRIYQRMVEIAFFSYPERYTTILPDSMIRIMPNPHPTYEFVVRQDTRMHQVVFEDSVFRPTTTETDNLRDLVRFIREIVEAHTEMAQLPPLQEECA